MDKLIRVDDERAWSAECASRAMALILTSRPAQENDGSRICSDAEERGSVVADTLEIAYSLLSITSDGVEKFQREARIGSWMPHRHTEDLPEAS